MVQGSGAVGKLMLDQPDLSGVLFTGSAESGRMIHKKFGGKPEVILALEMGGNNPIIAWDVDNAERGCQHNYTISFHNFWPTLYLCSKVNSA